MKNLLSVLILLACGGALGPGVVFADDATTLQVAPSDQVVYPDASQILNKTSAPAAKPAPATLPTTKPLVASTPVPAAPQAPVAAVGTPARGWYLRWTFRATEDAVKAWAQALGRPVAVNAVADGQWEVLEGPLDASTLKVALDGQFGKVSLVRR